MTQAQPRVAVDDLSVLLPDWRTHLRARNVAPSTIASYLKVGDHLLAWLRDAGMPTTASGITRDHLEAFLAALADRVSLATVAKHYRSLQQLFRWLVEDGEIPRSPMERMRPPAVPEQPVDVFTDDELRALLDAARGNSFENRRDTAMLRILIDTGMRAGELAGLNLGDMDPEHSVAFVTGKGRRGRAVPYGAKTADALRRYLRARSQHPHAALEALWVGEKGRVTDSGVRQMLERRATEAGVDNVHPHRFRHTYAHTWLASGGQEQDLMRLAGWRSREMVGRYAASALARVAGSRRASTAIRVARSRSSSGYLRGAAMTLILPANESLHQTRYGTCTGSLLSKTMLRASSGRSLSGRGEFTPVRV